MKKKVVIVDDDESIRKTFFLILNSEYRVHVAKDAEEHLNGLDMIAKFRESGYKGEVILISAFPDLVDPKELDRLSIGHFFVKPLDLDALNQSIDYLLSSERLQTKDIRTR